MRADGAWDTYTCAQIMSGHVATVFLPRMVGLQGVEEAQQVLGELPARPEASDPVFFCFGQDDTPLLKLPPRVLQNGKSVCFNTLF